MIICFLFLCFNKCDAPHIYGQKFRPSLLSFHQTFIDPNISATRTIKQAKKNEESVITKFVCTPYFSDTKTDFSTLSLLIPTHVKS